MRPNGATSRHTVPAVRITTLHEPIEIQIVPYSCRLYFCRLTHDWRVMVSPASLGIENGGESGPGTHSVPH